MTGIARKLVTIGRVAASICVLGLLSFPMAGCNNVKQLMGIEPVSPDEFAVESRAPLTVPPDFNLRPPEPGAPRPQETSMASKAQGVVDTAGPGQPGHQESGTLQYRGANLADPNAQIADQSLAAKLLQSGDTNDSAVL